MYPLITAMSTAMRYCRDEEGEGNTHLANASFVTLHIFRGGVQKPRQRSRYSD